MNKLLAVALVASLATSSFAFVPLSNQQTNLGSYRLDATAGMFYDELDIISAHPVSLLDFSGNSLYTTFGNVRNRVDVAANRPLSYRTLGAAPADNTFVFGLTGDPLSTYGVDGSRMGFVFQNTGVRNVFVNLDNDAGTGTAGLDSEGLWTGIVSLNVDGSTNGSIDRITTYDSSLKNYRNDATNQLNVGFAKKGFIFTDALVGLSLNRISNYNRRITGGTKLFTETFLNDGGMTNPAFASGTTKGDSVAIVYADNEADQNSMDVTEVLAQTRIDASSKLKVDVGVGIRVQNNYNPNSMLKNSITGAYSTAKLNTAGNAAIYDTVNVVRNPATLGVLGYADFNAANLANAAIWTPAWQGGAGVNAPAVTDFSDNRAGTGFSLRTEAVYGDITGVLNASLVPQKLDAAMTEVDYVKFNTFRPVAGADVLDTWVVRDYARSTTQVGDVTASNVDLGVKFDVIKTNALNLAFGGFIQSNYTLASGNQTQVSEEITSYTDGVAGDTPGAVALGTRPGFGVGEGVWRQTVRTTGTMKDETLTTVMSVPVGAEIPLSKKWTLRAGSRYSLTKTRRIERATADVTTTYTVATPAGATGAAITSVTAIADPASNVAESVLFTEANTVDYTYGVEWRPNENLTLACNAFLDTNANLGNDKATIFDLDTYRLLAIQAVFKF